MLAGVVALAVGLGAAELAAGLLGRTATPVVSVGEAFIDLVPGWLKNLAVEWFGTADKTVLLIGIGAVLVAAAAGIGLLAARHHTAGLLAATVLLAVAAVAVWSRPDTDAADVIPTVAAGVVALPALSWLVGPVERPGPAFVQMGTGPVADRRRFLGGVAALGALAIASGGLGRLLSARRAGVEASRLGLARTIALPAPALPSGADLEISGAQPWQTPNEDFYRIDTALAVPLVRAEDWQLRVHGMVDHEVRLRYSELVEIGLVDRWLTLTCVSNEVGGALAGNAFWTGVPLAEVIALAGPRLDADAVLSTSQDGWSAGTPLQALIDGRDALLAVGMNGDPLPIEHGFPVRMVVPGLYGYVSATKWVVDLEVSRFDAFDAYWTTRGWSEHGPVKVASRIDVPRGGASVSAGAVAVAGVAWAQHRGIEAVEVRVDGEDWMPADLAEVPSQDTWRQWAWQWDAAPGRHDLEVRAITADGETQTGKRAPVVPDGATGWHRITVEVER